MHFTNNFQDDLETIINKIESKQNFALARYADGELAVIENKKIIGCDGWRVTDEDLQFSRDLLDTCNHTESNYFYGISCPCCDIVGNQKLRNILSSSRDRLTYSNIFVNSNWNKAYSYFMNKQKVLICNSSSKIKEDFYKVPSNVLESYRTEKNSLKIYYESIATNYKNYLFCISAGPLAEIIIHWMYSVNPDNQYVDIGSCLDPYLHGRVTRDYQNSVYINKSCVFK